MRSALSEVSPQLFAIEVGEVSTMYRPPYKAGVNGMQYSLLQVFHYSCLRLVVKEKLYMEFKKFLRTNGREQRPRRPFVQTELFRGGMNQCLWPDSAERTGVAIHVLLNQKFWNLESCYKVFSSVDSGPKKMNRLTLRSDLCRKWSVGSRPFSFFTFSHLTSRQGLYHDMPSSSLHFTFCPNHSALFITSFSFIQFLHSQKLCSSCLRFNTFE